MNELKNKIYYWLKDNEENFLSDLESLIEIPSVEGKAMEGKPYGEDCAKALDTMLGLCKKHDFETKNFDYHAGTAIFKGKNDEIKLDILSHLDGDIARLIRFKEALLFNHYEGEVLCFDFQKDYVNEFLNGLAKVRTIKMSLIEAELGIS